MNKMLQKIFVVTAGAALLLSATACTSSSSSSTASTVESASVASTADSSTAVSVADSSTAASAVESAAAEALYTPGTYTAQATGMYDMVVEVTFSETAITSVEVIEHQETENIGEPVTVSMPAEIVASQSLAVDTVAGATLTSEAILAAVEDCVVQAGGNPDALK